MFKKGYLISKFFIIIIGFVKRFLLLFTFGKYNYIYIHREITPIGPPIFEWIIAKIIRRKIIYDFDDAIWFKRSSEVNPFTTLIKCTWKVSKICKWSYIVTTGNQFLANYANQFCKDVRIIPTVVDTIKTHNKTKNHNDKPLTIGWTGTFTNFLYFPIILPTIKKLKENYNFDFLIISDKDPKFYDVEYTFKPWNLASEIDDILLMHIGLMPLLKTDEDLHLGKCAFKAIQYMSLGIPAVVSPVGANCDVVSNGVNGYWADGGEEWYNVLEKLIQDATLRENVGASGQKHIQYNYSVTSTSSSFLNLFGL